MTKQIEIADGVWIDRDTARREDFEKNIVLLTQRAIRCSNAVRDCHHALDLIERTGQDATLGEALAKNAEALSGERL